MNQTNLRNLLVGIILSAAIITAVVAYMDKRETQPGSTYTQTDSDTTTWKRYSNNNFEFQYPSILTLSEVAGVVTLHHEIPYENSGDCDITGGTLAYDTLTDFGMTFELTPRINPPYTDGEFTVGELKGERANQGAEGCGHTQYYFPTKAGGTLLVKSENIQALSGLSTGWDKEGILRTEGAISAEKNDELLKQILSTFKFKE